MSAVSPLITNWINNKLRWTYTFQPILKPFILKAGQRRQLPREDFIFQAPEGVLLQMSVAFDDPCGGMSMESEPGLEFVQVNTAGNEAAGGLQLPSVLTFARIPPDTPVGIYTVNSLKEWPWLNSCKLYVINSSKTQSITVLGFGYTMAYLVEPRKTTLTDIERIKLWLELYPDLRPQVDEALKKVAKKQIQEITQ